MKKYFRFITPTLIFNFILSVSTLYSFQIKAQSFTEQTGISLTGVNGSSVAWGDYDNDGDLDILLTGSDGYPNSISKIYRNDSVTNGQGRTFIEQTGISLMGVRFGSVAWGDYDNDGDLDILLTGWYAINDCVSKIYRNDPAANGQGRTFTEQTSISLAGVRNSSVAWVDYDNDGDLDILLTGDSTYINSNFISKIYRNDAASSGLGRTFTEQTGISLTGVNGSSVALGDYDNDGDLDILLTGSSNSGYFSKIYRNDPTANGLDRTFSEQTGISLLGVCCASAAMGDYDNDGDLDILLTGYSSLGKISKIYRNDPNTSGQGRTFTEQTGISLSGVNSGSVAWGDYDNDGDLDILLTGESDLGYISKIYRNDPDTSGQGRTFTEQTGISLPGVAYSSSVAWGDYDNDGDLDILLTGMDTNYNYISKIYRNNNTVSNNPPAAPTGLSAQHIGDSILYTWNRAVDDSTAAKGLNYNIRIGSHIDSIDIKSPQANLGNGFHLIAERGMIQDTFYIMKAPINLPSCSKAYWTVQAIDAGMAGSAFSVADSINNTLSIVVYSVQDTILPYDTVQLGVLHNACGTTTYSWSPAACLDYANIQNPKAVITKATTFIVTVSEGGIIKTDSIRIGIESFTEQTGISLTGVSGSSVAWGDYDNDGDLDILLTGNGISKIYRNDSSSTGQGWIFNEQTGIYLQGVFHGSVDWGDYDNDGDLDILLTGSNISKIYRNDPDTSGQGRTFTEQTGISLTGVEYGSVAWGDYDNDGDLDILLTGLDVNYNCFSKIYRNDLAANGQGRIFTEQTGISLTGVYDGSVAWGDYDNDGYLDILLTGCYYQNGCQIHSKIYRNETAANGQGRTFTEQTGISLTGVNGSSVAWGDYDNDGDLDILLTGSVGYPNSISKIYQNNNPISNNSPAVPTGLSALLIGDSILFTWNRAVDDSTAAEGLNYNVRIGSQPDSIDIKSPMANLNNGFHFIAERGMIQDTFYIVAAIDLPSNSKLYWSVQAIDAGLAGSAFAAVDSIKISHIGITNSTKDRNMELKLFPNPNNGSFTLELNSTNNKTQVYNLEIYSAMGALIHKEKIEFSSSMQKKIQFENLSKGIYFIRLSNKASNLTKTFIVE